MPSPPTWSSFSADGNSLLITSSAGAQTARLVRLDVATGAAEVLAEDPEADVSDVRIHPDTREPQIVTVLKARSEYVVLDPSVADDLAAIRAIHPGDASLLGADDADAIWLVGFTNDAGPIPYYAYDRATKTARFLFEHQPELSKYELARMEPFSFQSRDGLTVHGYLTFPAGDRSGPADRAERARRPVGARHLGLQPRGAVAGQPGVPGVQVNFRGSTGYGKDFVNAGDRAWGAEMQNDISDAVAHVISQGWADPARVAIYGGSYGGYAALAGAAFTPDLYRCAVDIVGPSNLITLIESVPPYWAPMIAMFHQRVGDPAKDADFLWSRSPLSRAEPIRIPLLIAQGANDPRVKQAESEQIVAALSKAGIEHEYLLFPDEGHGFAKPENRLRFYAEADRFLARYLGGAGLGPLDGEDRDLAGGPGREVVQGRHGLRALAEQPVPLGADGQVGPGRELLGPDLDGDVRVRDQVVVPARMGGRPAVGGDHHVAAAVGGVRQRMGVGPLRPGAGAGQQQQVDAGEVAADAPGVSAELRDDRRIAVWHDILPLSHPAFVAWPSCSSSSTSSVACASWWACSAVASASASASW